MSEDRILLILGAGVSAPLGIPVMLEFLHKGRDLYFGGEERYHYFEPLLKEIRELDASLKFIRGDLLNIEHILSILEMRSFVRGDGSVLRFKRMVSDIVAHYTPMLAASSKGLIPSMIFNPTENRWQPYLKFLPHLFNFQVQAEDLPPAIKRAVDFHEPREYSVGLISFNYDLLIESYVNTLCENYRFPGEGLKLLERIESHHEDPWAQPNVLPLAKIHGTIEGNRLTLPTWNKTSDPNLSGVWTLASKLLSTANYIVVMGYSMPESDFYFRYLLSTGLLDAEHLKSIHCLTRDSDGHTKSRYENIISFRDFRFHEGIFSEDLVAFLNEFTADFDRQVSPEAKTPFYSQLLSHVRRLET